MSRSGWVLPSVHSPLCTLEFMHSVRQKEIYCPKREDVAAIKVCYSPPPKTTLITKLHGKLGPQIASGQYDAAQTRMVSALLAAM